MKVYASAEYQQIKAK